MLMTGFNGAATFQSRKYVAEWDDSPPAARKGFNGAATFQSRKSLGIALGASHGQGGFNGAATFQSRK